MIVIGEKINGFLPEAGAAIRARDRECIGRLARQQTACGADYLDICAGAGQGGERAVLAWLLEAVQDAVDTPVCIDSDDCAVIRDMLPLAKRPGIVNSVSGDGRKCDILFPAVAGTPWRVIALACDGSGVPGDADSRIAIAASLVERAAEYGISGERLLIDPMVMALAATPDAAQCFAETAQGLRGRFPDLPIVCGLSNISFGMPCRGAVNRQFLPLALQAGADTAILDPTSAAMRAALYAARVVLGEDRNGRAFLQAYRRGVFRPGGECGEETG